MKRLLLFLATVALAACGDSPSVVVLQCWQPVYEHDQKTGTLTVIDTIYTCRHS